MEGLWVQASPASLPCVLEQDTLILASIVDWDVENQIKQTNKTSELLPEDKNRLILRRGLL